MDASIMLLCALISPDYMHGRMYVSGNVEHEYQMSFCLTLCGNVGRA